jgi:hypothetical protein
LIPYCGLYSLREACMKVLIFILRNKSSLSIAVYVVFDKFFTIYSHVKLPLYSGFILNIPSNNEFNNFDKLRMSGSYDIKFNFLCHDALLWPHSIPPGGHEKTNKQTNETKTK